MLALCARDPLTQVDHSATTVAMPSDGVLVVDSVFALRPELDAAWDLRVGVDVDEVDPLARADVVVDNRDLDRPVLARAPAA